MSSKRTTSIVDISEIEDDEEGMPPPPPTSQAASSGTRPAGPNIASTNIRDGSSSPATGAQLYLYHEDVHPQQRVSSLLSSMKNNLQPPAASSSLSRSADTSPSQTLARGGGPASQLAIDFPAQGRLSPAARSLGADTERHLGGGNGGGGNTSDDTPTTASLNKGDQEAANGPPKANLGTLTGVYFPCVQNIFGVILFIRMVWIVGTAGVPAAFALVFICCCVTFTTSISLSAIATNGIVPAGGSYFMISRSLGPECGGAVGTLFFLGTTVAGAMYITGAVEIMLNYMAPSWGLFGDFQRDVNILYHNIRVYGTLLLILVGLMVWIGVKFVSKLAPIALFCVLFSIFSIYMGIFINYNGRPDLRICVVGDRLVTLKNMPYDLPQQAGDGSQQHETPPQPMDSLVSPLNSSLAKSNEELQRLEMARMRALCTYERLKFIFCPAELSTGASMGQHRNGNSNSNNHNHNRAEDGSQEHVLQPQAAVGLEPRDEKQLMRDLFKRPPNMNNCDPYFMQNRERIHLERAVPGIASGILFKNLQPRFREKGTIVSYDEGRKQPSDSGSFNFIFVDITTTFTILISIYFPSCTGILAGSNRSGDLADAQRSIPLGTIAAQLTTSFVYLSSIVLFGSTFNNLFIRDKFGESMGGQLAVTQIAWPEPYIILIGGLLSTLGASLQSLVGAPRILQGIAQDDVIPCFHRFAKLSARGEPETAVFFTLAIAELAVLIGNLDFIAPILTISLVMCYFFINLACALHSLLGSPNWRPRFKFYHWSFSMLGCLLCLFVMVVSSWIYFLVAILLASCIYRHIQYCGANKEWGDGKQGLALSAATYNLLKLTNEPHTKNWRPQLLLLCKLKPRVELEPPFSKALQLRALTDLNNNNSSPAVAAAAAAAQTASGNQLIKQKSSSSSPAGQSQHHLVELHPHQNPDQLVMAHPKLLTFASQLKAGKGLTLVSSIIEGDYKQAGAVAARARNGLQEEIQREQVKGFAEVVVSSSIQEGLCHQIQTAGLGGLKHNTVILGWPDHWRKPIPPAKPHKLTPAGVSLASSTASAIPQPVDPTTAGKRSSLRLHGASRAASAAAAHHEANNKTRAHLFIDLMRNVQVSQNALLVVKGVDSWPESCDKLGGTIDVWWIVNEGGLLMLLPHLLRQHRTWRACKLRIFTIAQASDNSDQMREDLTKFLYHLRIDAKVDIVVMKETEISDYAYERTLMMEQRGEIIKRLSGNRKQSILLEQEVDGGRLIRFRIRKPSIYDFEETIPFIGASGSDGNGGPAGSASGSCDEPGERVPMVELAGSLDQQHQQQSAMAASIGQAQSPSGSQPPLAGGDTLPNLRPDETNVRRMHTALSLNELILRRSKAAKLVILNLPGAPKELTAEAENNYMEFIEVLTDKLERVLLVQNGGREVITIHS